MPRKPIIGNKRLSSSSNPAVTSPSEPTISKRGTVLKIAGALIAVVALGLAARFLPIAEWLESFNEWVAQTGAWGIVAFIAVYIVAAVLFAPASVLTLGAGFAFGILWGMIAVSIASTLGAAAAFLVARYLARDWVRKKLAKGEKFAKVDQAVAEQGWKIVALLRLSPIFPYNALNYLLGVTGVRFWHFFFASWLGMLPGTLLYVYLGYAGRASLEAAATDEQNTLRLVYLGLGLLATVAVTIYVTWLARRAVRQETDLDESKED